MTDITNDADDFEFELDGFETPSEHTEVEEHVPEVEAEEQPKDKPRKSLRDQIEDAATKKRPAKERLDPAAAPAATETTEATDPDAPPVAEKAVTGPKAPVSWTPALREKFGTLPPEVQAQISKRELEMDKRLGETKQEREIVQKLLEVNQPYEAMFKEMNAHPFDVYKEALNGIQTLAKGTMQQKASFLAQLVKAHGVDIYELDSALTSAQVSNSPQLSPELDSRIKPLEDFYKQNVQQQRQVEQQRVQQSHTEVETFATDPKNEFFDAVATDMNMLMSSGRATSLKDAYDLACQLNPEVRQARAKSNQEQKQRIAASKASLTPRGPANTGNKFKNSSGRTDLRRLIESQIPDDFE
ncbi:hypothetical protein [Variovorax sp. LG9.2]|uniref:hypothetical protein n=1 Tax=Variovorax sp. LG9.2 TaxID=3048626 RepID=UPI002B23E60A|nr:hypothetical protein [Variovorax sp. LG9.2]MEB0057310.1 hypothetical protein [Variovorax sp. LG9.2]